LHGFGQRDLLCLNGEALTTFAATPRKHRLPVLGPHTHEETVRSLASAVVWLKRALHDCLTL
jgi:hypothetical protein